MGHSKPDRHQYGLHCIRDFSLRLMQLISSSRGYELSSPNVVGSILKSLRNKQTGINLIK